MKPITKHAFWPVALVSGGLLTLLAACGDQPAEAPATPPAAEAPATPPAAETPTTPPATDSQQPATPPSSN